MKKNLFMVAAVALMAMVSCNKEEVNNEVVAPAETMEFTAYVDGAITKASFVTDDVTNGAETHWEATDVIYVNGEEFKVKDKETGLSVTFVGNKVEAPFRAVFAPARGTFANVEIPAEQNAVTGENAVDHIVSAAYAEAGSDLKFQNLTSLLMFEVPVACSTVTISSDDALAGTVSVNDELTVSEVTTTNTVTLTGSFAAGTKYYAAVLPGTKTNLTFAIDGTVVGTITSFTINSSSVVDFGTLPTPKFEPQEGYIYLKPSSEWLADGARFAAYFFNETWADMTLVTGQKDIYQCEIPDGEVNIIFCRMNPSTLVNRWNDENDTDATKPVWTQSADLKMTDGNLYTVSGWTEGAWSGDPAVVAPEHPEVTPGEDSEWALAGTFNNWAAADDIMKTTSTANLYVAMSIILAAGDEIKVKAVSTWDISYGRGIEYLKPNMMMTVYSGGLNVSVAEAGTYDVYFDLANTKLYLMRAGTSHTSATEQTSNGPTPAAPSNWYIVGNFNGWNPADENYRMLDDGTYFIFDNFTAEEGCEMKFAPGKWSGDKGASGNFTANEWLNTGSNNIAVSVGNYKIYFKKDGSQYKFESK